MKTENLKEAPKSQWVSSIFWLIPLALVFGVLLIVGTFVLINWALPAEDAKLLKNLLGLTIGGSTGGAALSGAIGFVQRSLRLTEAKIVASETLVASGQSPVASSNPLTTDDFPLTTGKPLTTDDFPLTTGKPLTTDDSQLATSEQLTTYEDVLPRGRAIDSE